MSTDLDQLLDGASGDPTTPIDPDALWAAGRRRRWIRRASAAGGSLALVVAVALVGSNLTGPSTPDIAPLSDGEATSEATEEPAADAEAAEDQAAAEAQEAREAALQRIEELREQAEQERLAAEERARAEEQAEADADVAPTPSQAALADPCASHEARDMEAFIEVAGPVDGQQVGSSFELVGCSNVYEATVRYRLVGDGAVLVDDFTTAVCGSGCVGEFRQTVSVPAGSGELSLEVFWDSPADGEGERDKVVIHLERA